MSSARHARRKLWFKAKKFGWGWYPATWQGWLLIGLYLIVLLVIVPRLHEAQVLPVMAVVTAVLIFICYLTGEPPRWQWGDDHSSRRS